jgi:hypothetical protein
MYNLDSGDISAARFEYPGSDQIIKFSFDYDSKNDPGTGL